MNWTYVVSPKVAREEKRKQKVIQQIMDATMKSGIEFKTLVDRNTGYPKPVPMEWPIVSKNPTSYILSEEAGSTNGSVLAKFLQEDSLGSFPQFLRFLRTFPLPIYHIDSYEEMDMGYDRHGERAPIVDSLVVRIWTWAAESVPVLHHYTLNVDSYSKKKQAPFYSHSYSPLDTFDVDEDCLVSMMHL